MSLLDWAVFASEFLIGSATALAILRALTGSRLGRDAWCARPNSFLKAYLPYVIGVVALIPVYLVGRETRDTIVAWGFPVAMAGLIGLTLMQIVRWMTKRGKSPEPPHIT